jgi:rhodanese-related sulfurtransferase
MNLLKRIFRIGNDVDYKQLQQAGAAIIDVRTLDEFKSGHIKGSINVPLQNLSKEMTKIKKLNKPVIACCFSGGRSSIATKVLAQSGIEVYNGSGWTSLQSKIR